MRERERTQLLDPESAATGASFGVALQALFPGMGLQPEAYALVGMGAVFAAATDAPLAAVLMVFEMTNDYAIVLPLMLAVVISYGVAKRIEADSLYSGWLRRRGEAIERGVVRDVLATLRVADAMEANPQFIGETASVTQLLEHLWRGEQTDYPVVDDRLRVTGGARYCRQTFVVIQRDDRPAPAMPRPTSRSLPPVRSRPVRRPLAAVRPRPLECRRPSAPPIPG